MCGADPPLLGRRGPGATEMGKQHARDIEKLSWSFLQVKSHPTGLQQSSKLSLAIALTLSADQFWLLFGRSPGHYAFSPAIPKSALQVWLIIAPSHDFLRLVFSSLRAID